MSFRNFTCTMFSAKMLFTILCGLALVNLQAQDVRNCWANDYLEAAIQNDPATAERMAAIEKHTEKYLDKLDGSQKAAAVITIPTVVHVIYNTTAQNISEAQIQSQMQVLNDDFRRQNADASNTPSAFAGVAADTEIEFCLATIDPNGTATTGITRTSTNLTEFSTGSSCTASSQPMKFTSGGGKDAWPAGDYLNMWVCNLGGGILGYAQFPGSGCDATDGVVMGYRYFGTVGQAQAPFDGGRTATHEVGHWLNLRHIWGDGNCSADDFVSDTPSSDAANYGCASTHVSCNSADMVQNYMDYSDDSCMNLFTAGQKTRMQAVLTSGGARASLASSAGCGNGGGGSNYCTSQGNSVADEWIQTVALGSINNNSGANGGYQDFTSISTDLEQGSAYNFTLTPGYSATAYSEYWKVFIDFNQDLDFDDAGETVYDAGATNTTTVSGSITIPTSATLGNTRMRIVMKYTDDTNDTTPPASCGAFAYGETEDYTVNITTATTATCGATSGLSASNITTSAATLSWAAISGAASYNVRYRVSGTTAWSTGSVTGTGASISSLTASTTYDYQVQVVCSNGVSSSYTASANFTTDTPASCSTTSGLSISGITASAATLNWSAVTGASNYTVRYRVSGTTTWTTASASSNSYNFSGLANCTDYESQVRVNCSNGLTSTYSNSATFSTIGCTTGGYCTSQGNSVADEWIETVVLGSINNNSGTNGGYGDFTSISTDLEQGSAYNFTLTPGYTATAYTEYWKMWIDFNGDNDFDDAGEEVYDAGSTSSTAVSGTLTIPTDAPLGQTRMRIVMKYTDTSDADLPATCGSYAYGETEDYTVNITEASAATCDATSGLSSSNITTSGATLSWNAVSSASYTVRYRATGTSSWTTVSASSTSYSLSGLSASTAYEFQVKVNCSNGVSSSYTSSASFTTATPATCDATSSLSSSNITASSASLSWSAVSGASYTVRYRATGASSWTTVSASSASYSLSGLDNCTDYEFQVKVNCSNGVSSSYSSSATFSTIGCSTGGITYCESAGSNSSYFHISNVTLNSINNNTGDDSGYGDYASVSTELTTGDTYTVSATEGTTYNYDQDWRVWIDYNADGTFDNDEVVLNKANTSNTTVSSSFTVPSSAVLGTAVGMRVSMKYYNIPAASQGACDAFTYGEVEDYTITFAQGCSETSGLAASGMTETSATLAWSAAGGASSYNVRYRETNTSNWTTASASGTSSNISGLSECTNYEFQVQTVCSAGLSSAYSSSVTFSTTGCTNISYCNSAGGNSSYFHISNVSVGGINNNSGDDGGYGDYANVTTDLGVGDLYTISATEGTTYNYDQDWRAWVDFNANGVFEASEMVLDVPNTSNNTVSANFVIPTNATLGQVGMRVSMKYFNIPADSQAPCDAFTYGEVEDYTINLVEGSGQLNYCASAGSNSSYFHISNVSVGSLNNNSGDDNGYGDYTSSTTTLSAGSTYTVSATEGTTYNYDQDWRVWIDYNADGTFSSSEMVLDVADTGSTTVSSSFTVPSTASGEVRMRVSMKYFDIPAASQGACDSFTYGEVEDYTINISASGRTASSEKTMLDSNMEIFPNPATDFVNINFEVAETSETVNISIYDITGRLVVAESKTVQSGVQSEQFDLSNFDEGYYIVKIETGETVMTKRLVVAK